MVARTPTARHALLAVAVLLTIGSTSPVRAGDGTHLRYATPPSTGDLLVPQRRLFRCASEAGARYSAETGFLASDCARVERDATWRVVACTETTLSHGPLRLLEIVSLDGRRAWVPLPWHDWV